MGSAERLENGWGTRRERLRHVCGTPGARVRNASDTRGGAEGESQAFRWRAVGVPMAFPHSTRSSHQLMFLFDRGHESGTRRTRVRNAYGTHGERLRHATGTPGTRLRNARGTRAERKTRSVAVPEAFCVDVCGAAERGKASLSQADRCVRFKKMAASILETECHSRYFVFENVCERIPSPCRSPSIRISVDEDFYQILVR